MRVLVACEFSGIVRDAFIARGHYTMSCDLLPTEQPGPHYECDVRQVLYAGWDMMIAFPPCQYLCRSGQWRWSDTPEMWGALAFVAELLHAPIERIVLENPVGRISTYIRKPDQIIQPWQFGYHETKATCLWLKGLPQLKPTNIVAGRDQYTYGMPQRKSRQRARQRTLLNVALAMAGQWG
jgi:hypothetical protein